ncbi:extracellular solute-binding protein [Cellulomonas sp. APG4]|uniref:ABC transporter substrate-binding protein n=1 Tax=Cellulomonas sp. APG4 TaxID=1538656 RepID=UPI00137A2747|nr:extracellular solute-binding protein [Cellulomonas sp. APG4]NCT90465.1 extracellular solute-binding protein [Cellulomonas sp. APG4]
MRTTRRAGRRTAGLALVLGAATVLAACGSGDGGDGGGDGGGGSAAGSCTNTIVNEDAPVVTVWAWYPAMEQVVDLFNETHDDVQVCWTNAGQGGDAYQAFSTALEAGSGAPDVMMIEAEFLGQYTIRDALVDIGPLGAAEVADDYTEGAWSDVSTGDEVYAIPVDGGPMGFLYRQDIFDEYGVAVPTTWEEFADAAQALKDAGYEGYIANFPPNWWAFTQAMAAQKGWAPFEYEAGSTDLRIDMNSPEAVEVLAFWNELVQNDLVATDEAFTADYNASLVDGTYASYVAAAWGPGYLAGLSDADADAVWRAAPLPQWEGEEPRSVNIGGSTFAVSEQAENPELAAQVAIEIFGTEEAWKIGIEEAALFPLWRPILESDYFRDLEYPFFDGQQINNDVFLEAAAGYEGFATPPFLTYVYDQGTQQLTAMVEGSVDAATVMANMQDDVAGYAEAQGFDVSQ